MGKPIIQLGKNIEVVAKARYEIDACRLMVLRAAKAMDVLGNKDARIYVSAIKANVPAKICQIVDEAIQMHGGIGMTDAVDVGLFLKRARVQAQMLGDANFHRSRYADLGGY